MRARNLKPSLFKNELLATSDPLYAWIFEGLWCLADREGRLEDRPRKIHLEINAGRAYEGTETSLNWLTENGFIVRYQHGQDRYIQVIRFGKHQNPHVREPASIIPAPDEHSAGTVLAPDEHKSGPALSPSPLPDSPSLIPSPTGEGARKRGSKSVPEDFALTPELRSWSLAEIPDLDVEGEFAKFRDYEFRAPRVDWNKTWRRWVRTCKDGGRYAKAKTPGTYETSDGRPPRWM